MARGKEEITYGAAQAKLSEDESLRAAYKHGTPLEGGKITESELVKLLSAAWRMSDTEPPLPQPPMLQHKQQQQQQQQQEQQQHGSRATATTANGDGEDPSYPSLSMNVCGVEL